MYFRPALLAWTGTLTALLSLPLGCSLRLNDTVTKPVAKVSMGGCLAQTGAVLDHFAKGVLGEAEHEAYYACVRRALTTFADSADGKSSAYFEPAELGAFLTKYFLKGKPVPPGLLDEAMAVKVAMIGGARDRFTREELRHTLQVLDAVHRLTGTLRPLMPLNAASLAEKGYEGARFDEALSLLTSSFAELGKSLESGQGSYRFERLEGLLRELQLFLYDGRASDGHWTQLGIRLARALPAAKAALLSPPRDEISPADWPAIYRLAPQYVTTTVRIQRYLRSPVPALHGEGLKSLERHFGELLDTFAFLLTQHPRHAIGSEEIDDLLRSLHEQKLLGCSPETAKRFLQVAFGRLLGDSGRPDKFEITGAGLTHFKRTARIALEGLRAAEALYRGPLGDRFLEGSLTREQISATPTSQLLAATALGNRLSLEAVETLKRLPFEARTVFPASGPGVVVPSGPDIRDIPYLHMARLLGLRSLNKLVFDAYGDGRAERLTEPQVSSFLADVFPLLTELGIVDETLRQGVSKRLFEASLFLYSSDGDRGLTMSEALEMEALLLSTLSMAPRVHGRISERCAGAGGEGASEAGPVPASCYRAQFLSLAPETWSYLPGLAAHVSGLKAAEQADLFERMARFLRKGRSDQEDFTAGDSRSLVLFPYYVELLFSRFDADRDGKLTPAEADAAYPVFRPFIAEKAAAKGYTSAKDHAAIYNFLLAHRTLPTDQKWNYVIRRYLLGPESFLVDRGQVVEIFERLLSL